MGAIIRRNTVGTIDLFGPIYIKWQQTSKDTFAGVNEDGQGE